MSIAALNPLAGHSRQSDFSLRNLGWLALLTVGAFLIMGYHPGLEDDVFYLAAIKKDLNPALFPHDSDFFLLQFQATIFDKLIALSVRFIHLPLAWTVLFWQIAAIFFILHGCWRISRRCFTQPDAQWAAVTTIACLLTLPMPGIAINLADQYLHPRSLVTVAILAAIVAVVDRRPWLAAMFLLIAVSIHAIMASFGISFCLFLWWRLHVTARKRVPVASAVALLMPLSWMFEPASDAWRKAAATRGFYFVLRWHWYEWLGVFAELGILFGILRLLQSRAGRSVHENADDIAGERLRSFLSALLYYGVFQTVVGLAIMLPSSLERLRPFEPMRYLQLLYLLFFVIVGGLIGRYVLDHHLYRGLLLFLPLAAVMLYAQRKMYPDSKHLEVPGVALNNPWLQAFGWIRQNTPIDAQFALDPHYESLPGEDYHGFQALAERSALADYEKDGGMAARVPRLAPRWLKEVTALDGWQHFQPQDFERLKNEFGVDWVVLSRNDAIVANAQSLPLLASPLTADLRLYSSAGFNMNCPYYNQQLLVCRLY